MPDKSLAVIHCKTSQQCRSKIPFKFFCSGLLTFFIFIVFVDLPVSSEECRKRRFAPFRVRVETDVQYAVLRVNRLSYEAAELLDSGFDLCIRRENIDEVVDAVVRLTQFEIYECQLYLQHQFNSYHKVRNKMSIFTD